MKLEEATRILQKKVKSNKEVIKEARKNGDINVMQLTADLDNQSIAIERILQENQKLQRDNYKLDRENQKLFEIQFEYIPKKKIEDKIKELKEEKEQLRLDRNVIWDSGIYKIDLKTEALQELLEE